ncbi:Hyphal anastamosis-8 protein [Madurella fahalii]|uniref:Hyphal anastamosis-8 protein n=1 Tax=Madurella fahalii TaxID=1157608 RepID=A0ABQ0FY86_9PEZI
MGADEKKRPMALNLTPIRTMSASSVSTTDSTSTSSSLAKPPRTPRFAEATAVHSPIEPRNLPFSERSESNHAEPGDVGFGYIGAAANRESVAMPKTPKSPLKSAMKVPGTPGRGLSNPLSPTFREEQVLEEREKHTEKNQARDLRIKTRVRMAKFALRGVSFSCSLIILSMLAASFAIFNATRALPALSTLEPWSRDMALWPQIVVLACACVSLIICIGVFVGYCRGGHKRAEKVGVYYTLFAVGWFIFSMAMWAVAAGILQHSRSNSGNKDMWGWACVHNRRSTLQGQAQEVDYALVCRLQDWTLICIIIELVIEIISIMLYSIVFYRYWSKRKLHKSMDMRDKARSDLYLAQLRTQSAPNTPGFGPKSPAFSQYALSPRFPPSTYKSLGDIEEGASPFTPGGKGLIVPQSSFTPQQAAFKLQAPPSKANPATPATPKAGYKPPSVADLSPTSPSAPTARVNEHGPVAEGEQQYEAVPIPGAYAGQAIKSPPPTQTTFDIPRYG